MAKGSHREFQILVFGRTSKRRDRRAKKVTEHIAHGLRHRPGWTAPIQVEEKGMLKTAFRLIRRGSTPLRVSVSIEADDAPELIDWADHFGPGILLEEFPDEIEAGEVAREPSISLA